MESLRARLIEKIIDDRLTDSKLRESYHRCKEFVRKGIIDSVESAMFAEIYGTLFMAFMTLDKYSKRSIDELLDYIDLIFGVSRVKPDDSMEFERIFGARVKEIKSRIDETVNPPTREIFNDVKVKVLK